MCATVELDRRSAIRDQRRQAAAEEDRSAEERRWSAWMTAAQDGDAESYALLLAELDRALRAYLGRMLGGSELVDDCLQECLLALHRARHTYDPGRRFKPWAFAIATHKTIDVLRRRAARVRRELPEESAPASPQAAGTRPEARLDVTRALLVLDPPHREAVILTRLLGHSLEEAARLAGTSQSAMRSRVHRGLQRLRWALERELR